jgi:hypothetical protein
VHFIGGVVDDQAGQERAGDVFPQR